MREITKFRAWDNTKLKWIDVRECSYTDLFEDEKYIVQQWTGFVDAKGKDVYEGDFLDDSRFPITFNNGKFVVAVSGARIFVLEEFFEESIEPTVRGNIFENPKLLKSNS